MPTFQKNLPVHNYTDPDKFFDALVEAVKTQSVCWLGEEYDEDCVLYEVRSDQKAVRYYSTQQHGAPILSNPEKEWTEVNLEIQLDQMWSILRDQNHNNAHLSFLTSGTEHKFTL